MTDSVRCGTCLQLHNRPAGPPFHGSTSAAYEWGVTEGERESDARAEAAHKAGYEQGQRAVWDWLHECTTCGKAHEYRPALLPKKIAGSWADPADGHPYRRRSAAGGVGGVGGGVGGGPVEWQRLYELAHPLPDPHPGGTNPVAARVGTDGPA